MSLPCARARRAAKAWRIFQMEARIDLDGASSVSKAVYDTAPYLVYALDALVESYPEKHHNDPLDFEG